MLTTQHPVSAKKLALPSPTSGSRSVGIVRSRFNATELCYVIMILRDVMLRVEVYITSDRMQIKRCLPRRCIAMDVSVALL
jgi:hypothetical protein